jgi:phage N-6-adenine-methyltransferase
MGWVILNSSLYASESSDWETPRWLFEKLDQEFHFTLDVCASRGNAKCSRYFPPEKDGLVQRWSGVCWMNPPYGRQVGKWVQKAWEEGQRGCVVVCLLPVRSDTRWWHQWVMKSSEIRLLSKRLTFEGAGNKAPFPVAIVVFRKEKMEWPRLISFVV